MPKVIYAKIHGEPLLYTTMYLQLADQSQCYPKGVLEDVFVQVGASHLETVNGENTPILYLQNTIKILSLEGRTTFHEHILPNN